MTVAAAMAVLLLLGSNTQAGVLQPATATLPAEAPEIQFELTSHVWIPRLKDTARLGSGAFTRNINLDSELSLRDTQTIFDGRIAMIKSERYELAFSGFDFSVSGEGTFGSTADFGSVELSPGDSFKAKVELQSFAAEFGIHAWKFYEDSPTVDLWIMPFVSLRFADVQTTVEEVGVGSDTGDGQWLGTLGGVRFRVSWNDPDFAPWAKRIELDASSAIGPVLGSDGGSMWQLRAGLTAMIDDHFGLRWGFNLLELDVKKDDFQYEGGLQGLYLGGMIRF